VGAIAIIHWVTSISDRGNPKYSKPVTIVLGLLIAALQPSNMVGYTIDNLRLSFNHPEKPLRKLWSSKCIYSLILPLFHNTQYMDTEALIQAWMSN